MGRQFLAEVRLVEMHGVEQHVAQRLGDPTALDLLRELEDRLAWCGIEVTAAPPLRTVLDGAHPGAESYGVPGAPARAPAAPGRLP